MWSRLLVSMRRRAAEFWGALEDVLIRELQSSSPEVTEAWTSFTVVLAQNKNKCEVFGVHDQGRHICHTCRVLTA